MVLVGITFFLTLNFFSESAFDIRTFQPMYLELQTKPLTATSDPISLGIYRLAHGYHRLISQDVLSHPTIF
jgi:hypothetical protein